MLHDGVEMGVEFACRDAQGEDSQLLQVQVALVVFGGALGVQVAVDLDTQARLGAVEVEKVGTDGRLASEVEADLVAAQARPEAFFRLAHLTAHLAGACDTVGLPVAVRHAVSIRFWTKGSCWISPPSVGFPPLRPCSVPPACRGNLQEGVQDFCPPP